MLDADRSPNAVSVNAGTSQVDFEVDCLPHANAACPPEDLLITMVQAYRRTQRVYVHHRGQRPRAYHHISAYHRRHPKRVDQGQQMPVLTLTARRPRHVHSCQPQSRKTPARPSLRPNKCSRWRSTTKTTSGPSSLRKSRRVKKQCYTWATWTKP